MTSLEQARRLQQKIDAALTVFCGDGDFKNQATESEVLFRYHSISGILLMLKNDIRELCRAWQEEDDRIKGL